MDNSIDKNETPNTESNGTIQIVVPSCDGGTHEFDGAYKIRAMNETVEMNCVNCGGLFSWTFDEFDKICESN